MTESQAEEFRNTYIISDFEDEGHRTYEQYQEIKEND